MLRPAFVDSAHSLAAVGSEDCNLRVFHLPSASLIHSYEGHTGTVNAVAADLTTHLMATASDDHTIRIYRTPTITNSPPTQGDGGRASVHDGGTATYEPAGQEEEEQVEDLSDEEEEDDEAP